MNRYFRFSPARLALTYIALSVAIGIVVVLGAFIGWMIRRSLLFEVQEISGTASANQ